MKSHQVAKWHHQALQGTLISHPVLTSRLVITNSLFNQTSTRFVLFCIFFFLFFLFFLFCNVNAITINNGQDNKMCLEGWTKESDESFQLSTRQWNNRKPTLLVGTDVVVERHAFMTSLESSVGESWCCTRLFRGTNNKQQQQQQQSSSSSGSWSASGNETLRSKHFETKTTIMATNSQHLPAHRRHTSQHRRRRPS